MAAASQGIYVMEGPDQWLALWYRGKEGRGIQKRRGPMQIDQGSTLQWRVPATEVGATGRREQF